MSVPVSDWARRTDDAVDRREAVGVVRPVTDDVWGRFGNAPASVEAAEPKSVRAGDPPAWTPAHAG